jgi:hypothetical protein
MSDKNSPSVTANELGMAILKALGCDAGGVVNVEIKLPAGGLAVVCIEHVLTHADMAAIVPVVQRFELVAKS